MSARPCQDPGICPSRRCAGCPHVQDGPQLPWRTPADPPPTRGERIVTAISIAAWAACLAVTLTLAVRACGGA